MPFSNFQNRSATRTSRSLLEGVKDWSNQKRWNEFFSLYAPLIHAMARHYGLAEEDANDFVQETMVKVAKRLPDFEYDPALGSFRGWLRQVVRNGVIAHWRRDQKHRDHLVRPADGPGGEPALERLPDPSMEDFDRLWEEQWRRWLWETAKERVKAKVKPRQYQIFHCAVVKEWSTARIARDLRVNIGQVYFARRKVEKLIRAEVGNLCRMEGTEAE